jgi:quinol monooxygenase YgiN
VLVRIVSWQTDPRYRDILERLLRTQIVPRYRRAGCRAVYALHDEAYRHWRILSFWDDAATLTAFRAMPEHQALMARLGDFYAGPHDDRTFVALDEPS